MQPDFSRGESVGIVDVRVPEGLRQGLHQEDGVRRLDFLSGGFIIVYVKQRKNV